MLPSVIFSVIYLVEHGAFGDLYLTILLFVDVPLTDLTYLTRMVLSALFIYLFLQMSL
jgi:hypothetical protein